MQSSKFRSRIIKLRLVYYHVTILFAYSAKQDNLMLTVCEWHDENSILTTTVSTLKTLGLVIMW
jgi:hypothetical protein